MRQKIKTHGELHHTLILVRRELETLSTKQPRLWLAMSVLDSALDYAKKLKTEEMKEKADAKL